jgi:hypothetical protein
MHAGRDEMQETVIFRFPVMAPRLAGTRGTVGGRTLLPRLIPLWLARPQS